MSVVAIMAGSAVMAILFDQELIMLKRDWTLSLNNNDNINKIKGNKDSPFQVYGDAEDWSPEYQNQIKQPWIDNDQREHHVYLGDSVMGN